MNNIELMKVCEGLAKTKFHKVKVICLFDRDCSKINKKACENGSGFKHWGNNVYSVLLPVPKHRNFNEICIEHFYNDNDLLNLTDSKGRRIFLSNEFDPKTGKHLKQNLIFKNKNILKAKYPRVIDDKVFNDGGVNMALSKSKFAEAILLKEGQFSSISFKYFKPIFKLLAQVLDHKP